MCGEVALCAFNSFTVVFSGWMRDYCRKSAIFASESGEIAEAGRRQWWHIDVYGVAYDAQMLQSWCAECHCAASARRMATKT